MTEREFIRFYKKRNFLKNQREAKEKIALFWNALFKALDEDGKVLLKNWGGFEKKEIKSRKIKIPSMKEISYTETKRKIKFRASLKLENTINGADTDE